MNKTNTLSKAGKPKRRTIVLYFPIDKMDPDTRIKVKETTIVCINIADYMGHHDIPEYLAQLDALELYLQLIPKPHSDHYVGVYGLAGIFDSLKVQPTNSNNISYIMTIVRCSHICMRGEIFVNSALHKIMNQHKDVLSRMVVFIRGFKSALGSSP